MENWKHMIMEAESLVDLCKALNDMEDAFRQESTDTGQPACVLAGITEEELCELPTFGGEEPADTQGIFSWDETRYLVNSDAGQRPDWVLVNR